MDGENLFANDLEQIPQLVLVAGLLVWIYVVIGAIASRAFIDRRGKKLGIDWMALHHWRMAAVLFGPIMAVLFYFWSESKRNRNA